MVQAKYQRDGDPQTSRPVFRLTLHPDVLAEPYRWKAPNSVLFNSMSDLFHPGGPALHPGSVHRHGGDTAAYRSDSHQATRLARPGVEVALERLEGCECSIRVACRLSRL